MEQQQHSHHDGLANTRLSQTVPMEYPSGEYVKNENYGLLRHEDSTNSEEEMPESHDHSYINSLINNSKIEKIYLFCFILSL